ncbi:MAG TPA: molecular chaperone DnaK [Phycisphaerae bacterium]|nr:molecular chaperone DnaK [Phycisphaerae bacterium]
MAKIIGIDLGTTNSVVAIMEGSAPKVLVNAQGSRLTPSVVGFTDKGERLVGLPAKHQQVTNPTNTVFSIKRFMGRRHSEVSGEEKLVPYKIVGGPEELVKVEIRGKLYTPPEVSAMILQDLKKTAEDYLGEKVTEAIITVPAYFNDSQRLATKEAGEIAGLTVKRVLPEPTAAALAYGMDKKKGGKILVFDLGGGTFDVSVLDVGEGVFEVLSINGDTHLGGDDYDQALVDYIAEEFRKQQGIDLRKDPMALQRLKEAAEKAKIELSANMETSINLPFITADASGPKHLQMSITRSKFESLTAPLTERCRQPVIKALQDAKLAANQIDEILLVGGSTRMPRIQQMVKEIFGKEGNKSVNPDEAVAIGAAIQGGITTGEVKDILVLDVTPLSMGVETYGGVMTVMIPRNTTIPTSKSETFSTAADSQTSVEIHVLQGEREFAKDNRTLGKFQLTGIPPAPRGTPQIEVTFDIDVNGILNVKAKDKATGKENKVEIKGHSGLSKEEIDRMKKEAEAHADEDKKRREFVDLRNHAEALTLQVEKELQEHGGKVGPQERGDIESGLNRVKELLKGEDKDALQKAYDDLNKARMKLGEAMYKAQAEAAAAPGGATATDARAAGGPEAAAGQKKGPDDVIDAEYEVK